MPDGLADGDDRRDFGKVLDALSRCIPGCVEELIREKKVKWLVAGETEAGGGGGRQGARDGGRSGRRHARIGVPGSVDGGEREKEERERMGGMGGWALLFR